MAVQLNSLADVLALDFDDIIDVRAPSEWAEDHIPGAISLPVLDDEERARVGTIYKQVSPFSARPWPKSRGAGGRWSIAGGAGSGRGVSHRS